MKRLCDNKMCPGFVTEMEDDAEEWVMELPDGTEMVYTRMNAARQDNGHAEFSICSSCYNAVQMVVYGKNADPTIRESMMGMAGTAPTVETTMATDEAIATVGADFLETLDRMDETKWGKH